MDLHTLEKIRAEVKSKKLEMVTYGSGDSSLREGMSYNQALTELLHYLDTEISKAKVL